MHDSSVTMRLHDQGHHHQASPEQPSTPDRTAPSTESSQPPESTKFCSKCQVIGAKLEELLDQEVYCTDRPTRRVTSPGDLDHVVELAQKAKCGLCNFLSYMVEAYRVSQGNWWAISEVGLYIGSAKGQYLHAFDHLPHVHDSPLLWIWPANDNFLVKHEHERLVPFSRNAKYGSAGIALEVTASPNTISGTPIGPRANFELIRSWFDDCTTHHGAGLGRSGICQTDASVLSKIPGFMVIDCLSRMLVYWSQVADTKHCDYVALSYVWGTMPTSHDEVGSVEAEKGDNNAMGAKTPNPDRTSDRRLPSSLPRLIEDAITAVINLRFRYLWVDRYCIGDDPQTKHAQIQSMDLIYGSAALTIIAAEGSNPSDGLPGVLPRSDVSASVQIGSRRFTTVSTAGLVEKLKGSKWNSRGWTMQEAFLSTRCLFFLEGGAYFQCSTPAGQRYESIRVPLVVAHRWCTPSDGSPLPVTLFQRPILLTKAIQYYTEFSLYLQLPKDYFGRHLTFEDDSLNAFTGILRYLQSRTPPVYNVWGLLVSPSLDHRYNLVPSLAWSYARDQSFSKTKLQQPTVPLLPRKRIFPSWSWVDWRSETSLGGECFHSTHTLQFYSHDPLEFTSLVDLTAELSEGGVVVWENGNIADTAWLATVSHPPRVLNINGYTSHATLRSMTEQEWGEFCARTFPSNMPVKDCRGKNSQSGGHLLGCKMDCRWVMIDSDGKHLHYPLEATSTQLRRPWCWARQGGFMARNLSIDAYHLKMQSEFQVVANDEDFHSTTFDLRIILLGYDLYRMYYMVLVKSPPTVMDSSGQTETFERVNVVKVSWEAFDRGNTKDDRRQPLSRRTARLLSRLERKHGNSLPGTPWEKMSTRVI